MEGCISCCRTSLTPIAFLFSSHSFPTFFLVSSVSVGGFFRIALNAARASVCGEIEGVGTTGVGGVERLQVDREMTEVMFMEIPSKTVSLASRRLWHLTSGATGGGCGCV